MMTLGLALVCLPACADVSTGPEPVLPLFNVVSGRLELEITMGSGNVLAASYDASLTSILVCSIPDGTDRVMLHKLVEDPSLPWSLFQATQSSLLERGCLTFTTPFNTRIVSPVDPSGSVAATFAAFPEGRWSIALNDDQGRTFDRGTFQLSAPNDPFGALDEQIVFQSDRDGNFELYAMAPDGSALKRLTNSPAADVAPVWSPDGRQIAFHSDRDGDFDVYVMNRDGSLPVQVTSSPAFDGVAAWSPDGSRIAFQSNRTGDFEVYVVSSSGIGLQQLTSSPGFDGFPAWSPDGTRIAFQSSRDGNAEVYAMNADGTGAMNLTGHPASESAPSWAPDGGSILFHSTRDGSELSVYRVRADGSGTQLVTLSGGQPVWSPDGQRIAFSSRRDGNTEIYTMAADGSGALNRTSHPSADGFPDWGLIPAPPGPPHVLIAQLSDMIAAMIDAGSLAHGRGNALVVKLEAAQRRLAAGDTQAAIHLLGAFINQLDALVHAGELTSAVAQPLRNAAINAIAQLEETP